MFEMNSYLVEYKSIKDCLFGSSWERSIDEDVSFNMLMSLSLRMLVWIWCSLLMRFVEG